MAVSRLLRHAVLTLSTLAPVVTLFMAAAGTGKALELWKEAGWQILTWNALMLAPQTARKLAEARGRVAGGENAATAAGALAGAEET